jgi:mono/diheme cytochrome c family protein
MHSRYSSLVVALLGLMSGMPVRALDSQDFDQIERGKYLTDIGDCAGCHSRPGSGEMFSGGRPLETPFGMLLGPNITPDAETGIGSWTDDEFVNALTKGTSRNGTHLYPAMPYTYMTKATRQDVLAIRAYLNTVPAVHNPVQSNQLPFPFDVRSGMVAWNELFFTPGQFLPVAGKSAAWNRGAYIVEGLAHCGMCHTPKNVAGGDETSQRLQGYALQGWFAPNITNDGRRGLGGWSNDDIVRYLKTGHNRFSAASGPMAEAVTNSTSKFEDADLRAIAAYLKDQPSETTANNGGAPDAAVMNMGGAIYADECSACHTPDGRGVDGLFPVLNGSASVQSVDPTSILRVILRGARGVATDPAPTAAAMPSFGWLLNDEQVAAVATYVRNAWANRAPGVDAATVGKTRHTLVERSD